MNAPATQTHSPPTRCEYDAVVVGARCAGAATAMLLARGGMRVLAVDRSSYGSDTLSTHALLRPAVYQLHRWGVLERLVQTDTPEVRSTTFHYGDKTVALPIKPGDGVPALFAPRRSLLDALLVDAARRAGAEVEHGVHVRELVRSASGRVGGVVLHDPRHGTRTVRAPLVIGADGRLSLVARLVGARSYRVSRHHATTLFGYFKGPQSDGYHWYWGPGMAGGSIPTNGGLSCLFVAVPEARFASELRHRRREGFARLLAELDPEMVARLGGRQVGSLRGFSRARGYFRTAHGPGWALVGDAGYFKDPITAHGISDAFRDAELLARAVLAGDETELSHYQRRRDELSREFFEITDRIASFDWDTPALERLHLSMSEEMKRELRALQSLDPSTLGGHVAA